MCVGCGAKAGMQILDSTPRHHTFRNPGAVRAPVGVWSVPHTVVTCPLSPLCRLGCCGGAEVVWPGGRRSWESYNFSDGNGEI